MFFIIYYFPSFQYNEPQISSSWKQGVEVPFKCKLENSNPIFLLHSFKYDVYKQTFSSVYEWEHWVTGNLSPSESCLFQQEFIKSLLSGFPDGSVVKNPLPNAGDTDSIPNPGGSHALQGN